MTAEETPRGLPEAGERWRNKRTRRACKVAWTTVTSGPDDDGKVAGRVHYAYEEVAPGASFVQSPSARLDQFLAKFEKIP